MNALVIDDDAIEIEKDCLNHVDLLIDSFTHLLICLNQTMTKTHELAGQRTEEANESMSQ